MEYIRNIEGRLREWGALWGAGPPPSLWISKDFQWVWMDFLHVDSHLYLYYLQSLLLELLVLMDMTKSRLYGVKSSSGHDRMISFGSVSHISGTKLTF